MSRQPRIEIAGALYHVMARGNEKRDIFRDQEDYQAFIRFVGRCVRRHGFLIHAYALMPNHYHLLLETPRGELSRGLQLLNLSYARYFNDRHDRVGHLFQGRFKAILVQRDSYFLTVSRYIHQNPVKAGLAPEPWSYRWSSCAALLGLRSGPPWLDRLATLDFFEGSATQQIQAFHDHLAGPSLDEAMETAVSQTILGDDDFIAQMSAMLPRSMPARHKHSRGRNPDPRPSIGSILAAASAATGSPLSFAAPKWRRGDHGAFVAFLLRERGGLKLDAIARLCGLGRSGALWRINRTKVHLKNDRRLQGYLKSFDQRLAETAALRARQ